MGEAAEMMLDGTLNHMGEYNPGGSITYGGGPSPKRKKYGYEKTTVRNFLNVRGIKDKIAQDLVVSRFRKNCRDIVRDHWTDFKFYVDHLQGIRHGGTCKLIPMDIVEIRASQQSTFTLEGRVVEVLSYNEVVAWPETYDAPVTLPRRMFKLLKRAD